MAKTVSIEVVYSSEKQITIIPLELEIGTIEQAIIQSNILQQFPEIDLSRNKVGVFSELRTLDDVIQDGDRIEIYRPLKVDPKQARRDRAQATSNKKSL